MEIDVVKTVGAVSRRVVRLEHEGRPAAVVVATRTYAARIEEVWDALTNPERIPRWFLPISGELMLGGRYQLEGNAKGEITACEPPGSFSVTWEVGGSVTWLNVSLEAAGESTEFKLEHIAHVEQELWDRFGPGAAGVGWDMGIMGLELHLATGASVDTGETTAWMTSDNGKQFIRASSYSWGAAAIASGEGAAEATAAAGRTVAAYAGGEGPEKDAG